MLLTQTQIRVSCFLFDMDGTLLDSHAPMVRAYTDWAERRGLDVARVLHECQGRRVIDSVRALAPPGTDIEADAAALSQRERDDVEGVVEIPGAGAFLASLPPERWAVVTSADRVLAQNRLRAAGLPVPPLLITGDDIVRGKPAPDGFLQGARALNAAPGQAAVFEDSTAGIQAGLAAGAQVVAIVSTLSTAQIDALGPRGYVHDMRGLSVVPDGDAWVIRFA
ncbi:HAD-IA family hydrolase [Robbsia sp. Bb-Pol-6]|uniref:HAD-IA family hydrolase n=1 Tax=Robbsia betulipollinis TaxID=2981849 RepID=A0ABT3ZTX4_9BURK|nr:HAD-IA family hydrolase [Robbsia betulipollinis]MCY0389687.1 HAD-IA family hydrolase [Robbsia betulipollinis]